MKLDISQKIQISGKFRIQTSKGYDSDWRNNLVMKGTNTGIDIVANNIAGNFSPTIQVTSLKIGTGTTAPSITDTDLETPTVSTQVATLNNALGIVSFTFFFPDGLLPNGTYTELGTFCGSQIFTRALISPTFTKSTNEDTLISYTISVTEN